MIQDEVAQAYLITQVQTHLKTAVPAIRFIDEDTGQLEDYTGRPSVSWPCALLSTEIVGADDIGGGEQMMEADLIVRIALPPYSLATQWYDAGTKEKALKIYGIENEVYKALHGFEPEKLNSLSFRGSINEKREDPIRVRVMRFVTGWNEQTAKIATTTIPKPPMEWNEG
ncbi:MAG: hypothetical protein ACK4EY_16265 [Flavipsychrobacter sp.]